MYELRYTDFQSQRFVLINEWSTEMPQELVMNDLILIALCSSFSRKKPKGHSIITKGMKLYTKKRTKKRWREKKKRGVNETETSFSRPDL